MTAKEFLEQTSPNDKYGLRAELQKHRLRRMVEKEMEMYYQHKLKLLGISDVTKKSEQFYCALYFTGDKPKKCRRQCYECKESPTTYSAMKRCL